MHVYIHSCMFVVIYIYAHVYTPVYKVCECVCVIGICVDYLQSRLILQARLRVKRSKVEASALCSTGGLGG